MIRNEELADGGAFLCFSKCFHDDGDKAGEDHDINQDDVRPEEVGAHKHIVVKQVVEVDHAQQNPARGNPSVSESWNCNHVGGIVVSRYERGGRVGDGREIFDLGAEGHVEGDGVGDEEDEEEQHEPEQLHRRLGECCGEHAQLGRGVEELEHGGEHHQHRDCQHQLHIVRIMRELVQISKRVWVVIA